MIKLWEVSINDKLDNDTLINIFQFCNFDTINVCRKWNKIIKRNQIIWNWWYNYRWSYKIFNGSWQNIYFKMLNLNYNWLNNKFKSYVFYENSWILDSKITNQYIITASKWGMIKMWKIKDIINNKLTELRPFVYSGHLGPINCIDFDEEKKIIVSGSQDGTIRIWNINEYFYKKMLTYHSEEIYFIKLCNNKIYSGSRDCTIKIYDLETENIITLNGHTMSVWTMDFENENDFYSGSLDGTVKHWKLIDNNYSCVNTLNITSYSVLKVLFYNNYLFIGNWDGHIQIWKNNIKLYSLNAHNGFISGLKIVDNILITSGYDDQIKIWKIKMYPNIHIQLHNTISGSKITSLSIQNTSLLFTNSSGQINYLNYLIKN